MVSAVQLDQAPLRNYLCISNSLLLSLIKQLTPVDVNLLNVAVKKIHN